MIMDCDFYLDHINDELEGAKKYAKIAIEIKSQNSSWAKTYLDMATQELNHAKNFYDMFCAYYDSSVKAYPDPPKYWRDKKAEVIDCYTQGYSVAKYMMEMASK